MQYAHRGLTRSSQCGLTTEQAPLPAKDNGGPDSQNTVSPTATLYFGCFKTFKSVYRSWTHTPDQDQTSLSPPPTLPAAVSPTAAQDYSVKISGEYASGLLASHSSFKMSASETCLLCCSPRSSCCPWSSKRKCSSSEILI